MKKHVQVRRVALLLVVLSSIGTAEGQGRTASRRTVGFSRQERSQPIVGALRRYGWSIPLCLWRDPPRSGRYCVTVSRLLASYPLFVNEISGRVFDVALANAPALPQVQPEAVIEKLTGLGIPIGCVPSGPDKGVVVVGETPTRPNISAAQTDDVCGTSARPAAAFSITLGGLVANRPSSPSLSLSGNGQATYQHYLDECRAASQHNPRSGVMAGGGATPPLTDEEKLKEAEKKAAEEKKKAEDADAKKAAAQKALDDAKKKEDDAKRAEDAANTHAQDVYNDPNASSTDKLVAGQQAVTAANDRMAATAAVGQASADLAKATADAAAAQDRSKAADDAVADAQRDLDYGKAVDSAINDWGNAFLNAVESDSALLWQTAESVSRFLGAWWGRHGPGSGGECLADQGSCGSCEQQARARALRDELNSYRKPTCNHDVLPNPDDPNHCYEQNGLPTPSQAWMLQGIRLMCAKIQGVDGTCGGRIPKWDRSVFGNACDSPIAMCAPEQGGAGGSKRPSAPLPPGNRGPDSGSWRRSSPTH